VVIESPPYFHPGHAAGAVEAGRHVYLAKPPAVDVPGCTLVAESGKKATAKNLVYLIDFQTRADPIFREAVKRVHNGDIGRIVSGEAVYYCGFTFGNAEFDVKDPEVRLRHWTVDNVLSGDIITEQNVHALDVASWVIDEAPVRAVGTCGRKAKKGSGDLHDHFAVVFTFPGDVIVSFEAVRRGLGRYRRPHVRAARHARCALLRRGQHQGLGALCRRHDEESVYRRCGREHRRVPQLDRQQEVRQPDRGPERP
jgi:predicted dehydrogenase